MNTKISIIVPIFNAQNYLDETIQTVLNQTYSNWELLLIDDGSTDESAKICQQYLKEDARILYFYKVNGGQASARNLGIKNSSGEWLAMLDSDDLWHPEKLNRQITAINENDKIEYCFTNTSAFKDSIQNEIENYDKYAFGLFHNKTLFKIVYQHNHIANSSVMIKKSLLQLTGVFDENRSLIGCEDWDLMLRIFKQNSLTYGLKEKLLYYRLHAEGVHNQNIKMFSGKIHVYSKYDNDTDVSRLIRLRQYRFVFRELMIFLWSERKSEMIKPIMDDFKQKDKYGIATIKQNFLIKIPLCG